MITITICINRLLCFIPDFRNTSLPFARNQFIQIYKIKSKVAFKVLLPQIEERETEKNGKNEIIVDEVLDTIDIKLL